MSFAELGRLNHLFSIDVAVENLGQDLATIIGAGVNSEKVSHLISCLYDDLKPAILEWSLPYGASANGYLDREILNIPNVAQKTISNAHQRLSLEKDDVLANLQSCFPFKTWGYVYVKRLSSSILLESVGDRRIDEWNALTGNGSLPLAFLAEAVTEHIKTKVSNGDVRAIDTDSSDTEALIMAFAAEYNYKLRP